ncbi:cell envelope integrity protein CreD [Ahniella affigens]|uniref:Cell envelope integrity protein CreD n=1 Tax=Ahniella affigens TaxID=2021234 RepID=A0A2P1PUA5_9GAMM|nr:cell envelope integrity protein CreD [Ahniella affigens]AVP98436.1 cell envelope integrity protein CreD [Ahniella affigens]
MSVQQILASPTLKLFGIGALILVLLIPLLMIDGLRRERENRRDQVEAEIGNSVGGAQTVYPPLLRVPYVLPVLDQEGRQIGQNEVWWVFAPKSADTQSTLTMEERHRGIYTVPVYVAQHQTTGQFQFELDQLSRILGRPVLERAELVLPIASARAIRQIEVKWNRQTLAMQPGADQVSGMSYFSTRIPDFSFEQQASYQIELGISGARTVMYAPIAGDTSVKLKAPWPHPSFRGGFLPTTRTLDETEFDADWQVLSFNREIPAYWQADNNLEAAVQGNLFGVDLVQPVDVYFLNHRSAKYDFLFLVLTFAAFFLFEVIGGQRMHVIQYLLVGAALVVFYLVLLACSEHMSFAASYLFAALAMGGMISTYTIAVLRSARRALVIAIWLAVLYSALYVMINLEDFALLMGALITMLVLAVTMYLTRRIDWYGSNSRNLPPTPTAATPV